MRWTNPKVTLRRVLVWWGLLTISVIVMGLILRVPGVSLEDYVSFGVWFWPFMLCGLAGPVLFVVAVLNTVSYTINLIIAAMRKRREGTPIE